MNKDGTGLSIYAVELETTETIVKRGPKEVIVGLNGPQGIDYHDGKLFIATSGKTTNDRGNCVLEVASIDDLALSILNGTRSTALTGASGEDLIEVINCDFTRVQEKHFWRSIRVHPTGEFAIVSVGSDCNWSRSCTHKCDLNTKELQTTLVRMDLGSSSTKGNVSIAAIGVRNAIGLFFDDNENLIFTSFGSDNAEGIPNGNFNNVPDCSVEMLNLTNPTKLTNIEVPRKCNEFSGSSQIFKKWIFMKITTVVSLVSVVNSVTLF